MHYEITGRGFSGKWNFPDWYVSRYDSDGRYCGGEYFSADDSARGWKHYRNQDVRLADGTADITLAFSEMVRAL